MDPGFEAIEGVLRADACRDLAEALDTPRAGTRHLMTHPGVAALARSEPLLAIARRRIGRTALPYRATLFAKTGRANWLVAWHQDTALPLAPGPLRTGWGPSSTKQGVLYAHAPAAALERVLALRVHLDASTPDNGPLRVIPGSHARGVLPPDTLALTVRESRPVELTCGRGGVIAMRPLLVHASSKARADAPRRVLHIEYAPSLEIAPGVRLARA